MSEDFKNYLSVSKVNLNDKIVNHASVVYEHGEKLLALEDGLRRTNHKLELKEAQVYRNMAVKYQALKSITATRINHEVTCHPEIQELKERQLKILKALGLAKLKMKTLELFTDSIFNYGHNVREERKSSSANKIKN